MSNEQKQKLKDFRKEYYKKHYAEKKLNNNRINNYKSINNYYHDRLYYLIKHVRSSTLIAS